MQESEKLTISNTKISVLPIEATAIPSLEYMHLSIDNLASLPEEIGQLANLKNLIIWRSKSLANLPQALGEMPALEELAIAVSKIEAFPANLSNSKTLKDITLTNTNLLSDISVLMQMPQLESLTLSSNKIQQIPNEIVGLVNLKKLSLARNAITDVPSVVDDMPVLQVLDLAGTSVSESSKL